MKKKNKHNKTCFKGTDNSIHKDRKDSASSLNQKIKDNDNMSEQESKKEQVEQEEKLNDEATEQKETVDQPEENETTETPELTDEEKIAEELNVLKNDHIRLMAEFDNYRKRTLKEKSDLIKYGGEKALKELLPVVDDMERAISNMNAVDEASKAIFEGIELIHKKFMDYLSTQGVKPIVAIGETFDDSLFEAIAMVPAPNPEMVGKVIDCTRTGYMLNDKVLRFAAVVVGQ